MWVVINKELFNLDKVYSIELGYRLLYLRYNNDNEMLQFESKEKAMSEYNRLIKLLVK